MGSVRWIFILVMLAAVSCSEQKKTVADGPGFYSEKYRPQFHFSPEKSWTNDPNGLVFYKGEYHLFYQYYPDSTIWGPMHWGHAISRDLMHWEDLPVALYPDSLGYIFSGSAVADTANTSGLGTKDNPPLVAIFTYHNPVLEKRGTNNHQYQGLAYSTDNGRSWTKYRGNPVIANPGLRDFRDPSVSWNEAAGKWILTLAAGDHIRFYSSTDLINWSFESEFGKNKGAHGGVWECPSLFSMPVENEPGTVKWILLVSINPGGPLGGSATQYFTGSFDGHAFTPDKDTIQWVDFGPDNYAGITWSGTGSRRVFLGWMNNWNYANRVPTVKWRGQMTIPRELSLVSVEKNYVLRNFPVKELESITHKIKPETDDNGYTIKLPGGSEGQLKFDIRLPASNKSFLFVLQKDSARNLSFSFIPELGRAWFDRSHSGETAFAGDFAAGRMEIPVKFRPAGNEITILIDKCSAEIFINGGETVATVLFFPQEDFNTARLHTVPSSPDPPAVTVSTIESVW